MTVAVLAVATFVVVMVAVCAAFDVWGAPWLVRVKIRRGIRRSIRFEALEALARDLANDRLLTERGAW